MTDTNGIETTTWHDRKPTHRKVPKAVLVAREHADKMQGEYDAYVDEMLNNGIPGINWTEMEYMAGRANDAVRELLVARDAALNECSCTPDLPDGRTGHMCGVCLNRNDELPFEGENNG